MQLKFTCHTTALPGSWRVNTVSTLAPSSSQARSRARPILPGFQATLFSFLPLMLAPGKTLCLSLTCSTGIDKGQTREAEPRQVFVTNVRQVKGSCKAVSFTTDWTKWPNFILVFPESQRLRGRGILSWQPEALSSLTQSLTQAFSPAPDM